MPLRTRVGENARTAYIEEKFAQEARRRNYDANALLQKPKKNERRKRIVNYLSHQFARLPENEKRRYQYLAEKKWPLRFEHCNRHVSRRDVWPDPELVVQFDLDHFTKDRTYDPKRNQFITQKRKIASGDELKAFHEGYIQAIRQARGRREPKTPAAPVVPNNNPELPVTAQEHALARTEARKDLRDRLLGSAPGRWTFHKVLYTRPDENLGNFRVLVSLYRLADGADRTLSTIVLKRERRSKYSRMTPGQHRLSREEGDAHKLVYAACPQYVVGFIHHSLKNEKDDDICMTKRIMTDWVPHGTLWSLIESGYRRRRHLIPEPFIWYCFKVLTEVSLVCWNGHAGRGLRPGWEHMVNTDLKPTNIWLDRPDPEEPLVWARRYPKPKVGDFGMAWTTHHGLDDRRNARGYRRRVNPPDFQRYGTPSHMAPESLSRVVWKLQNNGHHPARVRPTINRLNADLPHTPLPWPNPWPANVPPDNSGIHSWTMVWEIGMTIWCMLATWGESGSNYDLTQPNEIVVDYSQAPGGADLPPRENFHNRDPRFHLPLRPAYSGRLVELVYQCLTFSPPDRIQLEDLWDEVIDGCNDIGHQYAGRENDPAPRGPNAVSFVPDKYPLGENVLNDF